MLRLWKKSIQVQNQSSDIRPNLVKYAAFVLNRQPYFRHQLREKLILRCKKLEFANYTEIVESILDDLTQSGYLKDTYLAEAYVRRQLSKGYGSRFIQLKLQHLKLSNADISLALESEATSRAQVESARHYLAKKRYSDPRKAMSALYRRGFTGKIIQILFDSEPDED